MAKMDWGKSNKETLKLKRGIEYIPTINDEVVAKRPGKRVEHPVKAARKKPATKAGHLKSLKLQLIGKNAKKIKCQQRYKKEMATMDTEINALKEKIKKLESKETS